MKPLLAIGLGNPLMGDDGIGWRVAERLAAHPRLPANAEAICGGTDLLRCAAQIQGRRRVILVDALQDGAQPGTVSIVGEDAVDLRQANAHHLSAGQAMQLLRLTMPVCFTLLGVSVPSARMSFELSPAVAARMNAILDRVIEELQ